MLVPKLIFSGHLIFVAMCQVLYKPCYVIEVGIMFA